MRIQILADLALASHWLCAGAVTLRYASGALTVAEGLGREDIAIGAMSALALADSSDGALRDDLGRYRRQVARAGDRYRPLWCPGSRWPH